MVAKPCRLGFTLVELLVVIVIIGMLAGLLTPAVLHARARARRAECANNQKNLGVALMQCDASRGSFPGYANRVSSYAGEAAWPVMLLPLLDRGDLWDEFQAGRQANVRLGLMVCPSDTDAPEDGPVLSYVANCGQPDAGRARVSVPGGMEWLGEPPSIPPDWEANGVFFRRHSMSAMPAARTFMKVTVTADDVKDGQQHTFLISERLEAGMWSAGPAMETQFGFLWRQTVNDTQCGAVAGINGDSYPPTVERLDLPSSYHPGGVNVIYCDGHGAFLDEGVSYKVYALQMTPDGSKVWGPGFARNDSSGKPFDWCREVLEFD